MLKTSTILILLMAVMTLPVHALSNANNAPAGKLDNTASPLHYRIHLTIDPDADSFQGNVQITIKLNRSTDVLWLHGKDLNMLSGLLTTSDGEQIPIDYEQVLPSGVAKVAFPRSVNAGVVDLTFAYTAEFNERGGLFKMRGNEQNYVVSQFQTIHARDVFPGFDEPRFKPTYQVELTVPSEMVAVTNAPLTQKITVDENWVTHKFEHSKPMPSYLVAFMVGPFDIADYGNLPTNQVRERELPLRALVAKGKRADVQYALKNTQAILDWMEVFFDSPYPYDKLDLVAPPGSLGYAMENPGAVLYDQYLIILDENASADHKRYYSLLHTHELSHMWFGNLVTPKWWDDLWLNESFATWMSNKASHAFWPEGEFDRAITKGALYAMNKDSLSDTQSVKQPVSRNADIAYALDDEITYSKGASILAMIENYVGAERFRAGIRTHMQRFYEGSADSDDFISSLTSITNKDSVTAIFNDFISLPGVPLVSASLDCSVDGKPTVTLRQSRYAALGTSYPDEQQWTMPVCVNHGDSETCHVMKKPEATIALDTDYCPAFIHPNSQNGYYRFDLDEPDWQRLIDNSQTLPAEQALTAFDSLDAALRADKASAETWLAGVIKFAQHPAWDVVAHTKRKFADLASTALTGDAMKRASAISRAIFLPIYNKVKDSSAVGDTILRSELQTHLLEFAKEPTMRSPLRAKAKEFVGMEGEPKFDVLPPPERVTALSVAVRDLGEPLFTNLEQRFAETDDPALRIAMIRSLAKTTDPALGRRLLDEIIGGIYDDYGPMIIQSQMSQPETRDSTYRWLKSNAKAMFNQIPENYRGAAFPPLVGGLCSKAKADDWEEFIESHAKQLPGYERSLGQTLEKIRRCASLSEAISAPLSSAVTVAKR